MHSASFRLADGTPTSEQATTGPDDDSTPLGFVVVGVLVLLRIVVVLFALAFAAYYPMPATLTGLALSGDLGGAETSTHRTPTRRRASPRQGN